MTRMFSARLKLLFALGILTALVAVPARSQDEKPNLDAVNKRKTLELIDKAKEEYRVYFKRPETAIEYWAAMRFEMDLGKFDMAAWHLKLLLEKQPAEDVDKDLVKLEQAQGLSSFLRLRQVRKWSDHPPFQKEADANVETLIDRLTKAVEKHLSNPDRIKKFIAQLGASTDEERAFAFVQLARSRERAVPYLIEALRVNFGKPLSNRLRATMHRIDDDTVPVYLEVFRAANDKDAKDIELRTTLLDIVKERDDKRVIPYLWSLSNSKKYPLAVREKATAVLAALTRTDAANLPPAKETLTQMAERYYQHKVPFPEGKPVQIWGWDGEKLALEPTKLTPSRAEELFGERYAREALEIDPRFQPAQIVLLSLILDRYYRPKMDQFFNDPLPPKMHQLLTTIEPDLAMRVLERAMDDGQLPVILPLLHALGERGETRAARPISVGRAHGIVRALYYPDRRVQFTAMIAMLRMPANSLPAVASERIVELSRRFLASETAPKALIVYAPVGQEEGIRDTVKGLGFTRGHRSQVVGRVREGQGHRRLRSGDPAAWPCQRRVPVCLRTNSQEF